MTNPSWSMQTMDLRVGDVAVNIAAIHDPGQANVDEPVVSLHGFGSTKEEYADFSQFPGLAGHPFLAYDAPGFGETTAGDLTVVSIPFLVDVALGVLDQLDIDRFHIAGHSMRGLTALVLTDRVPDRVLSFFDSEGNVAPEDCFLSRQIVTQGDDDPTSFSPSSPPAPCSRWSTPAPRTGHACSPPSTPTGCGPCSSPWSTSFTTVTCSRSSPACRCPGCSCTASRTPT